ncbi:MAG: hypothetical protein AAF393_06490 [Pseudomonadota bacterium]
MQTTFANLQSAREVAESLLEQTGCAIESGDFDSFRPHFVLPQRVSTHLGTVTINSTAELFATFERVRWHYRGLGITNLDRRVLVAMYLDESSIFVVHCARMFRGATEIRRPYKALSTLVNSDGIWRIKKCDYAIKDSLGHNRALYGPQAVETRYAS